MRILLTGGAGFIGSHIQDRLIELGHEVAILDNLRSGKKENLNPKSKFYEVDVCNKEALEQALMDFKPEAIHHLAAQNEVPFSMEHPFEDQNMNIVGMMNLMEASHKAGVKKIIYSNTGGAYYGDVTEADLPLVETFPVLKPTSFYGVSKMCAEQYMRLYGRLYGISWVALRYANVYGPRQDGNKEAGVVAIFTSRMLKGEPITINGSGEHTRDYIYVGDVVEANVKALEFDKDEAFNIATGVRTSNKQVFETIRDALGIQMEATYGPERPGDALHNCLSPQKAKEMMGWEAQNDFKTGVQKTVEYYRSKVTS